MPLRATCDRPTIPSFLLMVVMAASESYDMISTIFRALLVLCGYGLHWETAQ